MYEPVQVICEANAGAETARVAKTIARVLTMTSLSAMPLILKSCLPSMMPKIFSGTIERHILSS
jgi:hypothetical protein